MSSHKKYVNFLLILAGGLAWFLSSHLLEYVIGYFQLGRRLGGATDVLHHGLPILVGVGLYTYLRLNTNIYNFCSDAIAELVKVHFPSLKEVKLGTIVVIVTVVLAGIFLGALDFALNALVRTILGA